MREVPRLMKTDYTTAWVTFTLLDHESGLRYEWNGGAYIQIFRSGFDDLVPFDVMNVWDYEKDCPRIPATLEAFKAEILSQIMES